MLSCYQGFHGPFIMQSIRKLETIRTWLAHYQHDEPDYKRHQRQDRQAVLQTPPVYQYMNPNFSTKVLTLIIRMHLRNFMLLGERLSARTISGSNRVNHDLRMALRWENQSLWCNVRRSQYPKSERCPTGVSAGDGREQHLERAQDTCQWLWRACTKFVTL